MSTQRAKYASRVSVARGGSTLHQLLGRVIATTSSRATTSTGAGAVTRAVPKARVRATKRIGGERDDDTNRSCNDDVAKRRSTGGEKCALQRSLLTDRSKRKNSARKHVASITLRLHDFLTYARILDRETCCLPAAAFVSSERFFYENVTREETRLFDEKTFTDARYVNELGRLFGVSRATLLPRLTCSHMYGQIRGVGTHRKWHDWYRRDFGACFSDRVDSTDDEIAVSNRPPVVIRVVSSVSASGDDHIASISTVFTDRRRDKFARFTEHSGLKPITISATKILCAAQKFDGGDAEPRIDSLLCEHLKRLSHRSIYFRRVLLFHLILYGIIMECLTATRRHVCANANVDVTVEQNERNVVQPRPAANESESDDQRWRYRDFTGGNVAVFVESRLKPLIKLPTSWSTIMHADSRIKWIYQ